MSFLETYLFLFTDSFMTGLVLPMHREIAFGAMVIFGGYDMPLAVLVSSVGITLAACLNWGLGRMLRTCKKYQPGKKEAMPALEKIFKKLEKYGYLAALLGFVPILGAIVTVFAGLVQSSFPRVILLVFVTNLLWHGFLAM